MLRQSWTAVATIALIASVVSGCNGLGDISGGGGGGSPTAAPTSTSTTTPSPAPCGTLSPTAQNLVVVDMALAISFVSSSYGSVYGYAVDNGSGTLPSQAAVISTTSAGNPITSANTIQFTNSETSVNVDHSAVLISTKGPFPVPYSFPKPAASPTGSQISSTFWSTGRIPPQTITGYACYSQAFTLVPGTYYFGDLDSYNAVNFRDVLVVVAGTKHRTR